MEMEVLDWQLPFDWLTDFFLCTMNGLKDQGMFLGFMDMRV